MQFRSIASSSAGNCNRVVHGGDSLLLDCGVPAGRLIKKGIRMKGFSGGLITHSHKDHCKAAKELLKRAVDIYCLEDTAKAIGIEKHHRTHFLTPEMHYQIGCFKVVPFYAVHDVPCINFYIETPTRERMCYITDTAYVPAVFPGLDIIALEINSDPETLYATDVNPVRRRRVRLNHMGLDTALTFLRENVTQKLREVHILHMSNDNANAERILNAVRAVVGVPVYVCEE